MIAGRDFTWTDSGLQRNNVIITQAFEKLMGKGKCVGKAFYWDKDTSGAVFNVLEL
jgi:hypothetical protein